MKRAVQAMALGGCALFLLAICLINPKNALWLGLAILLGLAIRRAALLVLALIAVVAISAVTFLGVDSGSDFLKSEPVEFALNATLTEPDGSPPSWTIETRATISGSNVDRMREALELPTKTPFEKLAGTERDAVLESITAAMAASDYAPELDRGETLTFVHRREQTIGSLGLPPGGQLVRRTDLRLDLPTVSDLRLEPSSASIMTVVTDCNAFVDVNPSGESACVDGKEEREVSLDRGGSTERFHVSGRVAHPALRYAAVTPLVGLSFNELISALLGLIAVAVAAVAGDLVKDLVKTVFGLKPPPEAPK